MQQEIGEYTFLYLFTDYRKQMDRFYSQKQMESWQINMDLEVTRSKLRASWLVAGCNLPAKSPLYSNLHIEVLRLSRNPHSTCDFYLMMQNYSLIMRLTTSYGYRLMANDEESLASYLSPSLVSS